MIARIEFSIQTARTPIRDPATFFPISVAIRPKNRRLGVLLDRIEGQDMFRDKATAAVIAVILTGYLLFLCWNNWSPDLSALYFAAKFFALGEYTQIYAAPEGFFGPDIPASWQNLMYSMGYFEEQALPYVYPPIWAAVFAPMASAMTPLEFSNLFYLLHVPMVTASIFLCYRIVQPRNLSLASWTILSAVLVWQSMASLFALFHNQPQIAVAFLTLLAMERSLAGKSVAAGVALAIAATIKITPAVFILVFLLDRDWRALKAFVVTGGAITLASFAIGGVDLHLNYIDRIASISKIIPGMEVNWALESALYQAYLFLSGAEHIRGEHNFNVWAEPVWITVATKLVLVSMLGGLVWATYRLTREDRMKVLPLGLTLAIGLCGPLAWAHYFLPVILLLPALLCLFPIRQGFVLFLIFAVLFHKAIMGPIFAQEFEYYVAMLIRTTALFGLFATIVFAALRIKSATGARSQGASRALAVS